MPSFPVFLNNSQEQHAQRPMKQEKRVKKSMYQIFIDTKFIWHFVKKHENFTLGLEM